MKVFLIELIESYKIDFSHISISVPAHESKYSMYAVKAVHAINTNRAKMSLNAGTAQFAAEAAYATNAMVSKFEILKMNEIQNGVNGVL